MRLPSGHRLPLRAAAAVFLAALLAPASGAGQEVRGRLVAGGSGEPVSGAFVVLEDGAGGRADAALSADDGAFRVEASRPGTYRLSAERIGFRTWRSSPFRLERGETLSRAYEISVRPVRLTDLRVEAGRSCGTDLEAATAAHRLWEEARKALEVAAWTRTQGLYAFDTRETTRELDPETGQVLRADVEHRRGVTARPYTSRPAEEFAREGYVQRAGPGRWQYLGPDAEAFLSEEFRETHCFSVVGGEGRSRPGQAGLAFEPAPGRELPEISGVLWVDRESGELRELEFDYVNLPSELPGGEWGGTVEFARLEEGAWIVRRWEIRLPTLARRRLPSGLGPAPEGGGFLLAAVKVGGGEVTEIRRVGEPSSSSGPEGGTVYGYVSDRLAGGGLAGAVVRAEGVEAAAVADPDGRFRLSGVPPGFRRLRVSHPRLDALGLEPPEREVWVRPGEEYRLGLETPSAERAVERACPAEREEGRPAGAGGRGAGLPGRGAVAGVVRHAEYGDPLPRARVVATWSPGQPGGEGLRGGGPGRGGKGPGRKMRWEVRSGPRGGYLLCGVPLSRRGTVEIVARGEGGAGTSVRVETGREEGRRLLFRDLRARPPEGGG